MDDGHAISYQALRRGTVVRSADGVELGKVRRIEEETRSHIFDGIVIDTPDGRRFLDAPEVAHIAERAVTTTFPATESDRYLTDVGLTHGEDREEHHHGAPRQALGARPALALGPALAQLRGLSLELQRSRGPRAGGRARRPASPRP